MGHKLNPRRRPASDADVLRTKKKATDAAMQRAIELMLFSMKDLGATDEQLTKVAEKLRYTVDGILRGDITWNDVKTALKEEYAVTFEFS